MGLKLIISVILVLKTWQSRGQDGDSSWDWDSSSWESGFDSLERGFETSSETPESTNQSQIDDYTSEEELKFNSSVHCFTQKHQIDLRTLSGIYYVPYIYAPPYWTKFGTGLCKWLTVVPDSMNSLHYFGGYFGTNEGKLGTYNSTVKFNKRDKVYNVVEHFIKSNKTAYFNAVPCIASPNTFMFQATGLNLEKECVYQTFVFSRNPTTAAMDKDILEQKCYSQFNITLPELPYLTTGCHDVGLF